MNDETIAYTCILPVYNEEGSLPLVRDELLPVLRELDGPFELLVVNDGSTDGSAEVLEGFLRDIPA